MGLFVTNIVVDNFEKYLSNIMINVHKDRQNKMKWKQGPKNVVITDFERATSVRVGQSYMAGKGTPGCAPPEQWLGQFMKWSVFIL